MNIFFLDRDPVQCATWMVDKHVVKMIVESAQILATSHRLGYRASFMLLSDKDKKRKILRWRHYLDDSELVLPSATHINHPCVNWVVESPHNYFWLADHALALAKEYTYRYGKIHKYKRTGLLDWLALNLPDHVYQNRECMSVPNPVLSEKYKMKTISNRIYNTNTIIELYKHYYSNEKSHIHSWTKRQEPAWIEKYRNAAIPVYKPEQPF